VDESLYYRTAGGEKSAEHSVDRSGLQSNDLAGKKKSEADARLYKGESVGGCATSPRMMNHAEGVGLMVVGEPKDRHRSKGPGSRAKDGEFLARSRPKSDLEY